MKNHLLEQLYKRYARELYLYIYSFYRDANRAEDIMHDVSVKALVSLDSDHENFKAWLYKVAKNTMLNVIEKEKRVFLTLDMPEETTDDTTMILLKSERNRELYNSILKLPEHYKQVLLLQYISEMPQAQIAEVLGMKPGNIRVLAYRAKKELKQIMEVNHE